MRVPRIYSSRPLHSGARVELDESATRHLLKALRLKAGDPLILFDGSGADFDARLLVPGKARSAAEVGKVVREEHPPPLQIHLALGISRGERMDFAIQKAVELGVGNITPLFTRRSMVQLRGERLANRTSHWQGVVRHACEQSGRSLLPQLQSAGSLAGWLGQFHGTGILLDHRADNGLQQLPRPDREITLLVGPEGGLAQEERQLAGRHGFTGVRLGPRILRTETAPLAAISAMQTLWGDFR